jgi:fructokinase
MSPAAADPSPDMAAVEGSVPESLPSPILVCGEALFDVFPIADTATGLTLDARIGGSPFNVAMGLCRLGQTASFLGTVSTDAAGDRLMRAFADEGIDTACLCRSPARTTLSVVGLDARGIPSYAFYGEGGADRQLTPAALDRIPTRLAAVQIGSYATVVEPIASTLEALVRRQQGRSLIAYDPNVRLNVEPDVARWRHRIETMLPLTTLLKVSDEDLERLYGPRPIDDFAAEAQTAGVALVVVTRGGDGAVGWVGGERLDVPPVRVPVVDTVGAGDTFQAALLARLAEVGSLSRAALTSAGAARRAADALGFAARAAAITCSRRGADLPRRTELAPAPMPG